MKKQIYIRTTEEVGLPSFNQMQKGYAVMTYHNQQWNPIHNSWGYPYTQLGHAIRKAYTYVAWRMKNSHVCIVEVTSGKIMWASWELNDHADCYIEHGEMAE